MTTPTTNGDLQRALDEATARASLLEERLREIQDLVEVASWHLDLRTNAVTWTPGLFRLFGLPVPEGKGNAVRDHPAPPVEEHAALFDPESWARVLWHLNRATSEGLGYRLVLRSRALPRRHYEATCRVRTDESGTPTQLYGTFRDVTELVTLREERVRTEARLATNEALLLQFVKHTPAATVMLDRELHCLTASDAFLQAFVPEGAILGIELFEVVPWFPAEWRQALDRVLQGHTLNRDTETLTLAGRPLHVRWQARPWFDGDGHVGGVLVVLQDITAERRLRAALVERERQLELRNSQIAQHAEDLAAYAHAASHELQRPLNELALSSQLLQEHRGELLDARSRALLEHVVHSARDASTLIRELVEFTELSDRPTPAATRSVVGRAIRAALADLRLPIRTHHAEVEVGMPPHPVAVRVGRVELVTVISKLVHNALVHSQRTAPRIQIDVHDGEDEVLLRIRDHGVGIPAPHREDVFSPFRRLHDTPGGSGIGLAWCRRVLNHYGGRIWIAEPDGGGAEVRVTMPRAPQSTAGT